MGLRITPDFPAGNSFLTGPSSVAFNPLTLNPNIWFSASKESYSDWDEVTLINDQSGNARSGTPPTSPARPTFRTTDGPNNRKYLSFDGIDDRLLTTWGSTQPCTIWMVARPGVNLATSMLDGKEGGTRQLINCPQTINTWLVGAGSYMPAAYAGQAWLIARLKLNGSSSSFFVNSSQLIAPTDLGSQVASSGYSLGANFVPGGFNDMLLAEFLVVSNPTNDQITALETYWTNFYNII